MSDVQKTAFAFSKDVIIMRMLEAPRALVFKAWIDPQQLAQWWGPEGFTNPICEMDVRPGGAIHILMRAPNGLEHPMTGVFDEIVEPERIVFTSVPRDKDGHPLAEVRTVVTFAGQGNKTRLTVHASGRGLAPVAEQMLGGMEAGWTQSLDRLAACCRAS